MTNRVLSIIGTATLIPCLQVFLPMANAYAHGFVSSPPSRQARCAQGAVQCGAIKYEPQSVEGPKGLNLTAAMAASGSSPTSMTTASRGGRRRSAIPSRSPGPTPPYTGPPAGSITSVPPKSPASTAKRASWCDGHAHGQSEWVQRSPEAVGHMAYRRHSQRVLFLCRPASRRRPTVHQHNVPAGRHNDDSCAAGQGVGRRRDLRGG